jgi:hypothetical protein
MAASQPPEGLPPMKNRYVRTRRWVGAACAALFVGLVGVLFAHDHQPATASDDDVASAAPVTSERTLPLPSTTLPSTTSQLPSTTSQSQLPSTRTLPSTTTTQRPQTTHTRTRAS